MTLAFIEPLLLIPKKIDVPCGVMHNVITCRFDEQFLSHLNHMAFVTYDTK